VDSPLGFIHHPRVDAMETRQLSSAQEVPHSTVGWKVMTTIFWDCKGVLLVDYIPQKTIMTGPYYSEVLTNLRQAVKEKRREILIRGPLLLHDNAPALMSRVAQAIVKDIGFEQLSRPPYSPDLTPSDFYLFRHLKQHLRGTRFFDDDEL